VCVKTDYGSSSSSRRQSVCVCVRKNAMWLLLLLYMYIYVYMYIYMSVCMYTCIYMHIHIHTYVCIYTCINTYSSIRLYKFSQSPELQDLQHRMTITLTFENVCAASPRARCLQRRPSTPSLSTLRHPTTLSSTPLKVSWGVSRHVETQLRHDKTQLRHFTT